MRFPKFNKTGGKLPELCRTVEDICKVLPQLDVHGDNVTTFVDEHTNGKIIRAKPKQTGGVAGASEGSAAVYDGPWAFDLVTNNVGTQFFRVKRGYFVRNGLYAKIKDHTSEYVANFGWQAFNVNNTFVNDGIYYVHIYQEWVFSSKAWRGAELRVTQDAPPEGIPYSATDLYGYCLLGWVRKTTVDDKPQLELHCYEIALPIMFVSGECRTGETLR